MSWADCSSLVFVNESSFHLKKKKLVCRIRALIPSIVRAICCYILASNHKNDVLPGLPIVKIFTMLLQYHPIFKMVL